MGIKGYNSNIHKSLDKTPAIFRDKCSGTGLYMGVTLTKISILQRYNIVSGSFEEFVHFRVVASLGMSVNL